MGDLIPVEIVGDRLHKTRFGSAVARPGLTAIGDPEDDEEEEEEEEEKKWEENEEEEEEDGEDDVEPLRLADPR